MEKISTSEVEDTGSIPVMTTKMFYSINSLARCFFPQFGQKYSPRLIQKFSSFVDNVQENLQILHVRCHIISL